MDKEHLHKLIKLSLNKDERAFREIVRHFQKAVFSFTFRMLCNEDDAKDTVQDTFIRLWLHLKDYDGNKSFSTWIYAIAANLCLDRLKSGKIQYETSRMNLYIKEIASKEDIEGRLANLELARLIASLTNKLPPKQKLVFTLRYFEELDVEEIIQITGMDAEKIKSNLYVARKTIRDRVEKINK